MAKRKKVQKDKQRFSCDRLIGILFIAERPAISISAIFRTRTGSIIYVKKKYTESRERMGQRFLEFWLPLLKYRELRMNENVVEDAMCLLFYKFYK